LGRAKKLGLFRSWRIFPWRIRPWVLGIQALVYLVIFFYCLLVAPLEDLPF